MIIGPGRKICAMLARGHSTNERSGSRWGVSGVGTQLTITSHSTIFVRSAVASNRPGLDVPCKGLGRHRVDIRNDRR